MNISNAGNLENHKNNRSERLLFKSTNESKYRWCRVQDDIFLSCMGQQLDNIQRVKQHGYAEYKIITDSSRIMWK